MSHSGLVRITDFAFLRPICQGAFAHVYLARKIQTGRLYAVKVVRYICMYVCVCVREREEG
jgi:serine/threonine protein kinase